MGSHAGTKAASWSFPYSLYEFSCFVVTVNSLFPPIFLHSIFFLHIARMDHAILHFLTRKQSSPNRQRNSPRLLGLFLLVPDFPPANALYWFFGFANFRPLAISADTFPFAGRNHLFSDKIRKSLPEISWQGFSNLVREKVIAAGKRERISGTCKWKETCKTKEPAEVLCGMNISNQ